MDYTNDYLSTLSRNELQLLAKQHGIAANQKTKTLVLSLSSLSSSPNSPNFTSLTCTELRTKLAGTPNAKPPRSSKKVHLIEALRSINTPPPEYSVNTLGSVSKVPTEEECIMELERLMLDDDETVSSSEAELYTCARQDMREEAIFSSLNNTHSDPIEIRPAAPTHSRSSSFSSLSPNSTPKTMLTPSKFPNFRDQDDINCPSPEVASSIPTYQFNIDSPCVNKYNKENKENVKVTKNKGGKKEKSKKKKKDVPQHSTGAGFMSPSKIYGGVGYPTQMTAKEAEQRSDMLSPASRANKSVLREILGGV